MQQGPAYIHFNSRVQIFSSDAILLKNLTLESIVDFRFDGGQSFEISLISGRKINFSSDYQRHINDLLTDTAYTPLTYEMQLESMRLHVILAENEVIMGSFRFAIKDVEHYQLSADGMALKLPRRNLVIKCSNECASAIEHAVLVTAFKTATFCAANYSLPSSLAESEEHNYVPEATVKIKRPKVVYTVRLPPRPYNSCNEVLFKYLDQQYKDIQLEQPSGTVACRASSAYRPNAGSDSASFDAALSCAVATASMARTVQLNDLKRPGQVQCININKHSESARACFEKTQYLDSRVSKAGSQLELQLDPQAAEVAAWDQQPQWFSFQTASTGVESQSAAFAQLDPRLRMAQGPRYSCSSIDEYFQKQFQQAPQTCMWQKSQGISGGYGSCDNLQYDGGSRGVVSASQLDLLDLSESKNAFAAGDAWASSSPQPFAPAAKLAEASKMLEVSEPLKYTAEQALAPEPFSMPWNNADESSISLNDNPRQSGQFSRDSVDSPAYDEYYRPCPVRQILAGRLSPCFLQLYRDGFECVFLLSGSERMLAAKRLCVCKFQFSELAAGSKYFEEATLKDPVKYRRNCLLAYNGPCVYIRVAGEDGGHEALLFACYNDWGRQIKRIISARFLVEQ